MNHFGARLGCFPFLKPWILSGMLAVEITQIARKKGRSFQVQQLLILKDKTFIISSSLQCLHHVTETFGSLLVLEITSYQVDEWSNVSGEEVIDYPSQPIYAGNVLQFLKWAVTASPLNHHPTSKTIYSSNKYKEHFSQLLCIRIIP